MHQLWSYGLSHVKIAWSCSRVTAGERLLRNVLAPMVYSLHLVTCEWFVVIAFSTDQSRDNVVCTPAGKSTGPWRRC